MLSSLLVACGQVDPVVGALSMPDCTYQGPVAMEEGNVRVILTRNGLGNSGAALVEIGGDGTYADLEMHLRDISDRWDQRPAWLSTRLFLTLDDREAIDGVEDTTRLSEGSYALLCVDYPYDGDSAIVSTATPMMVERSGYSSRGVEDRPRPDPGHAGPRRLR